MVKTSTSVMNKKFNISLLPGDGIGQEISIEAKKFLIGLINFLTYLLSLMKMILVGYLLISMNHP